MNSTLQAEAVMLLTVSLGKSESGIAKPLTPREWGEFAGWLKARDRVPGDLLKEDLSGLLQGWEHPKVTTERLQALLGRGAMLGFALERWQRAGLWVLTRSDPEYPARLKRRLGQAAPAILFGCGNKSQLDATSVAVVGSRHADDADLRFADDIGRRAAACGRLVVSGGAAGVDQAAMLGALDAEGTAIGVVADSLLRSATSAKYRRYLMSGDLALISPFNPEVRFLVGNAMSRNKYIYCMAQDAIVVSSTANNGGTWQGAVENLRRQWVPLWVKKTDAPSSGNPNLVELGGRWLEDLGDLVRTAPTDAELSVATNGDTNPLPQKESIDCAEELYDKVRSLISDLCIEPKQADEMAAALRVTKRQVHDWIGRLVDEGVLTRLTKPVRYVVREKDLIG